MCGGASRRPGKAKRRSPAVYHARPATAGDARTTEERCMFREPIGRQFSGWRRAGRTGRGGLLIGAATVLACLLSAAPEASAASAACKSRTSNTHWVGSGEKYKSIGK